PNGAGVGRGGWRRPAGDPDRAHRLAQARSRATVSRLTSSRIVALTSPLGCRATAVRELLWGSIPMVITGYFLSRVMGSPATGNLTSGLITPLEPRRGRATARGTLC